MLKYFWIIIYMGLFLASCTHGESVQPQRIKNEYDIANKELLSDSTKTQSSDSSSNLTDMINNNAIISHTHTDKDSQTDIILEYSCEEDLDRDNSLFMPIYLPDENTSSILEARKKLKFDKNLYEAILLAENWVVFQRVIDNNKPSKADAVSSTFEFKLVHLNYGIIKKNDYKLLSILLKDIDIFNNRNINVSYLSEMISVVLDDKTAVLVCFSEYIPWITNPKIIIKKDEAIIEYWNYDTMGEGFSHESIFTHHLIFIDNDYVISDKKESRITYF